MLGINCSVNRCLLFALLIFAAGLPITAQTTIYNVPSTDVVAEQTAYLEADFLAHFDSTSRGGFQTYGYRVVYGARKNLEIGANFFISRNGSRTSPKEFQPNLKLKVYGSERLGIGVSTGAIFFVPLDKAAGTRTFGMTYGNVSKTVKQARGMRLTGGFYRLVGAKRSVGTKTGAIIGIEQPVNRRLIFLADWYSGKNRFGYSAAGFSFAITKRQFLFAGYNFGNTGRANNFFSAFYGITF
ncbi:MAG: hypothetical protein LH614_00290 [Pyrinomonadaceae bacterium]|nr:hypothetical protein [Pyrinomonadaceae bacterium]